MEGEGEGVSNVVGNVVIVGVAVVVVAADAAAVVVVVEVVVDAAAAVAPVAVWDAKGLSKTGCWEWE